MRKILFYLIIIINIIVLIICFKSTNEYNYDQINVEIKGAVKKPGVYQLNYNDTVESLVKRSGGLLKNADISVTNMSKKLNDEMVVIIYTKEEIDKMREGATSVKYIDKECICPKLTNDSCLDEEIKKEENIIISEKISLNSATKEELMNLPGIGESKAIKIIDYRNNNNGFKRIEEIMNVKGIGNSIYEKIKDYITL